MSYRVSAPALPTNSAMPEDHTARQCLHRNFVAKLRPLPFQYIWALYHQRGNKNEHNSISKDSDCLTVLTSSISTIAEFYQVYNNFPWSSVQPRDSVHLFRSGVKPFWEDPENAAGGRWTLKIRRSSFGPSNHDGFSQAQRTWEEICLIGCGGELQAALAGTGCKDAVLGMTFASKRTFVAISIWMKFGDQKVNWTEGGSVGEESDLLTWQVLQKTVLERLSPELKPASSTEYQWRQHRELH